ncbi:hypothetical protein D3C85_560900 [compost metagenome]
MYRELGAHVGHVVGEGLAPGHGADIDDRAMLALDHAGYYGMNAVEQAFYIDVEHLLPLCRVLGRDVPQQHDAGIIDQGVGRAELCFGVFDRLNQGRTVGDVDATAQRVG